MITPQHKEILDTMALTPQGRAIAEFIEEEKRRLNDVTTIDTLEEVLGRKRAIEILNKLFAFVREKKIDSSSKNQYN